MARLLWGKHWLSLTLLLVLAVVGTVGILQYRTSLISKKEANLRGGLFVMREALDEYAAAKGGCPSSLKALIDLGYLRAIPRDPMTGSESTWQFERTATHCDVKSGAPQMARNGTAYRNW